MRNGLLALLCLCGCNGLFEADPNFTESDGNSTSDAQTTDSPTTEAPSSGPSTTSGDSPTGSSTEGADTPPTECVEDTYEDNDSLGAARVGELIADGPFVVEANLDDSADEDWFKVDIAPSGALRPEPSLSVVASLDTEVCIFVRCTLGDAELDCGSFEPVTAGPNEGDPPGCCGTTAVSLGYDCIGAVELDGFAYGRVRAAAPIDACLPYVATISDAS